MGNGHTVRVERRERQLPRFFMRPESAAVVTEYVVMMGDVSVGVWSPESEAVRHADAIRAEVAS